MKFNLDFPGSLKKLNSYLRTWKIISVTACMSSFAKKISLKLTSENESQGRVWRSRCTFFCWRSYFPTSGHPQNLNLIASLSPILFSGKLCASYMYSPLPNTRPHQSRGFRFRGAPHQFFLIRIARRNLEIHRNVYMGGNGLRSKIGLYSEGKSIDG